MTEAGSVYGEALYDLAKGETLSDIIQQELEVLESSFSEAPEFLKLLASPALSKAERCQILDDSFRGKVHIYVLNFLKLLTEKGYIRHFPDCCRSYAEKYNQEHGILPVTAVTAVPMSDTQMETLKTKLNQITGKQIKLHCRIDPVVLGGIRLDYDGQRLDDTVSHRMDAIRDLLTKTVL